MHAKTLTPSRHAYERANGKIPNEQWEAGHALWRTLRWDVLMNPDGAMRILVPLIVRAAKADELEAKLAEEAA